MFSLNRLNEDYIIKLKLQLQRLIKVTNSLSLGYLETNIKVNQ